MTKQQTADAFKKVAETEKIRAETQDENIQPLKTAAEIDKIAAEIDNMGQRGMQQ